MKTRFISFGLLLLFFGSLIVADPPKAAPTPDVIKTAPMFGIGPLGIAGIISAPEKALRQLVKEKDARQVLIKLLSEATIEGQMYALVGLILPEQIKPGAHGQRVPCEPSTSF